MHKAILYQKIKDKIIKCTACAHYCHIGSGRTGVCGVRKNIDGKLFLLVYGKPVSINIDPIEKKPLFHFLPGTDIFSLGTIGCNFACEFCQNWNISQITKLDADFVSALDSGHAQPDNYPWPPQKIVNYCLKHHIPSIAYTYNEPTIFIEYAYDTARLARRHNIKNVFVSNGYGSKEAYKLIGNYLDGINIDLKSFNPEYYQKICHSNIKPVLENIKRLHSIGIWIEITTLVVPNQNDSDKELIQIAEFIAKIDSNIPWHISRFFPQYQMSNIKPTPVKTLKHAYKIGKQAGLNYVYIGNMIDSDCGSTYCNGCGKMIIKRIGYEIGQIEIKNGKCAYCREQINGVWK